MKRILFSILLIYSLTACSDSDNVEYSATGDAYIRAMNIDGSLQYAPVLVLTVSDETSSATATDSSKKRRALESYWKSAFNYRWLPSKSDYLPTFNSPETYSFLIRSSNSDEVSMTESVNLSDVPSELSISSFTYDNTNSSIEVSWNNVGADLYILKIATELDEYPIYQSPNLIPTDATATTLSETVTLSTLNWFSNPKKGENYVFSVHGFNLVGSSTADIGGEVLDTIIFTWGKKHTSE